MALPNKNSPVGISIEGLESLSKTLNNVLPREAKQLARGTVGSIASAIRKDLASAAPKRTGAMKRSFFVKRNRGTETQISADVRARASGFYWRFINFGTSKLPATNFVEHVVISFRERLPKLWEEQFGKRLEKLMARKRGA